MRVIKCRKNDCLSASRLMGEEEEIWDLVDFMILVTKYVYSKGDRLEDKWKWISSSPVSHVPSLTWVFFPVAKGKTSTPASYQQLHNCCIRKRKGKFTRSNVCTQHYGPLRGAVWVFVQSRCEVGQRIRPMKDLGFVLKFPQYPRRSKMRGEWSTV